MTTLWQVNKSVLHSTVTNTRSVVKEQTRGQNRHFYYFKFIFTVWYEQQCCIGEKGDKNSRGPQSRRVRLHSLIVGTHKKKEKSADEKSGGKGPILVLFQGSQKC